MMKKTFKAAFVLGAMLVSASSFAADVDYKVPGRASMTPVEQDRRLYNLNCGDGRGTCYTAFKNGYISVNIGGGDVWFQPASYSPPPVLRPDPENPDNYLLENTLILELNPGQVMPEQ
jgi:hypothetical protein